METLIIEVNCKPNGRNGTPQLGITVEAPYLSQQRQQQAKDDRNHDYQNLPPSLIANHKNTNSNDTESNNINSNKHNSNTNQNGTKTSKSNSTGIGLGLGEQRGLQITQIQEGSVIDRNGQFRIGDIIVEANGINLQRRSFQEAQKTLREFVVKQSSHGPLLLRVLRKADSSSSLPSTTGSQATVIERHDALSYNNNLSPTSTAASPKKSTLTNSASTPSPQSAGRTRNYIGALNTRRIGTKHRIELTKSRDGGFGIKIAERDNMFGTNRPIYITAITTTGSAYSDGRLREGDMLLEINGVDLSDKSQTEVTRMLKSVRVNESVEFLVSRQEDIFIDNYDGQHQAGNLEFASTGVRRTTENGCDNDTSLIDLDVPDQDDLVFDESNHHIEDKIDSILNLPKIDGPGTYVYDIPLNDTKSAGLGLYLKYPTLNGKDLGIWIEKVITGGAASKDGRLRPDDQILAINGINLMGLSNSEASETLTAAVCRGFGPEATSNTIRLNIHRRDPSVVAKILHGTNTRIEDSDLQVNARNKLSPYSSTDRMMNSTQESFKTAFDSTLHNRSQSSSNETNGSNRSSNLNSQNDSAMSPQTQASNSFKLSNSCHDKSDHNNSDKTNDTSSAISQITDFTTVPINDINITPEKDGSVNDNTNRNAPTLPKTLEFTEDSGHGNEPASSTQSCDDDSIDATTGEERFQRDGFGRQSISEKRHAQLMAKNTDTFRRNQKQREERQRQREIEAQLARQALDDDKRQSLNLSHGMQNLRIPQSRTTNGISGHQLDIAYGTNLRGDPVMNGNSSHREVPVDVYLPVEPVMEVGLENNGQFRGPGHTQANFAFELDHNKTRMSNQYFNESSDPNLGLNNHLQQAQHCWKCGSAGPCICRSGVGLQLHHQKHSNYGGQNLKKSNSLESIQHHDQIHEGLIVPRAGTVRVARNRKINESFRAAVDRSYESSINDSVRFDFSGNESHRNRSTTNSKITSSVANSTTSTSNDERFLISESNNISNPPVSNKKSSSLLTRFLKFGSIKKSKKRNKEEHATDVKQSDTKAPKGAVLNRDSETSRSHTPSKQNSHSRTQSSQSHPCVNYNSQHYQRQVAKVASQIKSEGIMNNDGLGYSVKQQQQHFMQAANNLNNMHIQHPNRASAHMYQYNHLAGQLSDDQMQQHRVIGKSKLRQQNALSTPADLLGEAQLRYAHIPANHIQPHQHQGLVHPSAINLHHNQRASLPLEIQNHCNPQQFQMGPQQRNYMLQNPMVSLQNGRTHLNAPQWQSPPVQSPNGLWVANSTMPEGQSAIQQHHQQQQQQHNIYEFHHRQQHPPGPQPVTHMHNQQHLLSNITHPTPFIPTINGQNPSRFIHQQPPILQGHTSTMTRRHLLNQQPPHIYYYDF